MQLDINGKSYTGKFGIKFARELDRKYGMKRDDISLGMALSIKAPMLLAGDVVTLVDFLYISTITESKRPKIDDIEIFVEEHENIEALFDEVIDEVGKSNATKLAMKEVKKNMEQNPQLIPTID